MLEEGQYDRDEKAGLWTYYSQVDGKKRYSAQYKNDVRSGSATEWCKWHENGQITEKSQYNDEGEATGLWERWYENGKKRSEATYKLGVQVGNYTEWHDNGEVATKGQYNDEGNQDGTWQEWHDNGKKHYVGQYKNGNPIGQWKRWNESGELFDETNHTDGDSVKSASEASEDKVAEAIDYTTEQLTQTSDAQSAAESLGTNCQFYKRKDQCVIAYFTGDYSAIPKGKNAKHYRALYGKVGELYIIQDFYINGYQQSNTVFARSESGILSCFDNADLNIHGTVQTYTPQGKKDRTFRFVNGEESQYDNDEYDAAQPAAAAESTKAATNAVIDAAAPD